MKNRMIAICMALFLAAGLTACNTEGGSVPSAATPSSEGAPSAERNGKISEKLIEPTFFLVTPSYMYTGQELVFQAIRKKTNIQFKPIVVTLADYNNTLATTLASGDLPDVMGFRESRPVKRYGQQGAFLNLKTYMDVGQMPNFVAMLEKYPPAMQLASAGDGGVYGAPRIYDMDFRIDQTLLIREDLFKKHNIPTTFNSFEDIHAALKQLKELYPSSTPYINRWNETHLLYAARFFDAGYTFFESPLSNQYEYGPVQPGYKDCLAFLRGLYADGLLDPEFATLSDEQFEEKLATEKAFMAIDYPQVGGEIAARLGDTITDGFTVVSAVQPAYNGNRIGTAILQGYYQYTKTISAQSKYKEELVKFMEWTYSDEGIDTLLYGIEGDSYTRNGDEITLAADINYPGNLDGTRKDHCLNDQNVFSVATKQSRDLFEVSDPMLKASMEIIASNQAYGKPGISVSFNDADEQTRYNELLTPLETYVRERSVEVITGEMNLEDWDSVVIPQLTSMNYEEALGLIRKAYNETLGK